MIAGTALIQVMPLLADQLPEAAPAELAVEREVRPGPEGGEHADHLGVDVEEGQRAVAAVAPAEPVALDHAGGHVRQLPFAQQDSLRRPGGPAGAEEDPAAGLRLRFSRIKVKVVNDVKVKFDLIERSRGFARQVTLAATGRGVHPVDDGGRLGHAEHPGDVGVGRRRVQRDGHPAGRDDRHQRGRVLHGLAEPDHDPGAGRQPGRVQPSFNVGDGVQEPGVAERRRPPRVRQVQVGAVAGGRLLDPIAYQGSHPSGQYIIRGSL